MSEEQASDVEEIKIRLGEEIPVSEEPVESESTKEPPDIVAEFQKLGRQFGETMRSAWQSQERRTVEAEMREGIKTFTAEVDKVFREVKTGSAAQKARQEATELRSRVETGEVSHKARTGVAQGLQWLSEELAKLASQFTPAEQPSEEESEP